MTISLTSADDLTAGDGGPQVYRPQEDSALLIDVLDPIALSGARTLDLCTGTGVVAIASARRGAEVTAVDYCPHAVDTARRSAREAGVDLRVLCADVAGVDRAILGAEAGFDVITCNPPYVPTPPGSEDSVAGPTHAWNAGPDGRAVLDVLCTAIPTLLAENGSAFIVQSTLADADATVDALRRGGLHAKVVRERLIPFGPVLRSRRDLLVSDGLLDSTSDKESIVVVRADRGTVTP